MEGLLVAMGTHFVITSVELPVDVAQLIGTFAHRKDSVVDSNLVMLVELPHPVCCVGRQTANDDDHHFARGPMCCCLLMFLIVGRPSLKATPKDPLWVGTLLRRPPIEHKR